MSLKNPIRSLDVIMYLTIERMKRHSYKNYIEFVRTGWLKKIREFDRSKSKYGIDIANKLAYSMLKRGVTEPLIVAWYPPTGEILLVEGNHRLLAAESIKLPALPVRVLVNRYKFGITKYGYDPVKYVKPIEGYVPQNQKPSDIGIPIIR
jgi:hypothetical protein